jgi:hypothetical protein
MFTPQDIDIITRAIGLYRGASDFDIDQGAAVDALADKLAHLGRIGKKVAFTYDGQYLTGRLDDIRDDVDGITRARIASKGFLHFVTLDQIHGLA